MSQLERSLRGLRWIASTRLLTQVVTWALTVLTIRALDPNDYGIVATSGLFTNVGLLVMDGGLMVILVQERNISPKVYRQIATAIQCASLILYAALWVAAPFAGSYFQNDALSGVIRIAALQLPLSAMSSAPLATLAREMKFRELAITQTVASVVQGGFALALARAGAAEWALVYATLVGLVVRLFLAGWYVGVQKPDFSFSALAPFVNQARYVLAGRTIWFAIQDLDIFLLSRLSYPGALGTYSVARSLAQMPFERASEILNQISIPAFASKSGDLEAQIRGLKLLITTVSSVAIPFFWITGMLAQTLIPAIFGEHWKAAIFPFVVFSLVMPFRTLYSVLDSVAVGLGRNSASFKNMLTWACMLAPVLIASIVKFGADGAAISWALVFPIVLLVAARRLAQEFKVSLTDLGAEVGWYVLYAFCALGTGIYAKYLMPDLHPFLLATMQLILSTSVYVYACRRFSRTTYNHVFFLLVRVLNGRRTPIA